MLCRYSATMRWLLHGPMSTAVGDALRRHGHTAVDMTEAGLPPATDPVTVLTAARTQQLDILTTNATMSSAPFLMGQRPGPGRSMVYLQLEGGEEEQGDAVDRLFTRYKRLTPGRLYTVTAGRVKVRQLPGEG